MKKKFTGIFIIAIAVASIVTGCKKNDTSSTTATPADYAGTYNVTGNCGNYSMTITASGSNLTLTHFHTEYTLSATVSGNTMTIPSQSHLSATGAGPYIFAGSGTLSGNTLTISYTMKDSGGASISCSPTATK